MESRIRSIFLIAVAAATIVSGPALAEGVSNEAPQVIEPKVARRDIDVRAIDTEDFEVTAFVGLMGVEDFETGFVYGGRLAYHVTPSLFIEGSLGRTTVGDSSAEVQNPGINLLPEGRDLTYYDVSLGWNILSGESFFGSKRVFNSAFYLIGGIGSTDFADDNNFTLNFGFGFKLLPTDSVAIRFEGRDYVFDSDVTGANKTMHNMQASINISLFF